ncbi:TolC family protein [Fusobacterium hominis]|uniref:TolC family protein n=1 Tax=Fusobacterium hominis TaxID=2764326 RepID=A0A7G9GVB6_9FUSO|nr:TolC family protein [Fusobacterium hominis]QNM14748.1 TolC family protein [Fusobacterium hominis]
MRKQIIGIFLLLSGISYSQEMGLNEILDRAKTANPNVIMKKMDTDIKRKEKQRALKNYVLPPVNLSDSEEWEAVKRYGVGTRQFRVSMDVFEGGKSVYGYRILKSQVEMAENEEILTEIKAQEEAVNAYFSILNAQKQSEITTRAIELLKKQRQRNFDLYENGKILPKSEYLKIEADIEDNNVLNIENQLNEENNRGVLAKLLGYPLDSKIALREFDPENYLKDKSEVHDTNNKKIEDTLLAKNEQHKVNIAENTVKIAKADLYPSINVEYKREFYEIDDDTKERKKLNDNVVTLGFKWVFEWGGTLDNIQAKKIAYEQAKVKYDDEIKKISLDIRNKLNKIKSLYGQSLVMKKRMELLEESANIDSMRYENELLSTFDYLNSVNKYRAAQENYYRTQRDLVLAIIEYENLYR